MNQIQTPIFQVTHEAMRKLCYLAENRDKQSTDLVKVRVALRGGGCSGFTVEMDYTIFPSDELFDLELGPYEGFGRPVLFVVDVKSAGYLQGATLDWDTSTLLGQGFKWTLPKSTGGCGCGTSFAF